MLFCSRPAIRSRYLYYIKLFQFTLSDQSLQEKTEREYGILMNNKTHSCVNSGSQYRTAGVFFRVLPYCDCHCCHAILLLLVMSNEI